MDINGKKLVNIPHAVSNLITNDERQDQAISDLEEAVRQALVGVFHYKGSVATYADLPAADNQVGDVYNVLDTGANYAWAGTEWDDLSGIVDLSNYVTLDGNQTITGIKVFYNGFRTSKIMPEIEGTYIGIDKASLNPLQTESYNLGSSTSKWKDIYSSGVVYTTSIDTSSTTLAFKVAGVSKFSIQQYSINFYQNLLPSSSGPIDIGSDSLRFKDIYSSGDIITTRLKSTTGSLRFRPNNLSYDVVTLSSSELFTYVKMRPAVSGIDLGDASNTWRDVYINGAYYFLYDATYPEYRYRIIQNSLYNLDFQYRNNESVFTISTSGIYSGKDLSPKSNGVNSLGKSNQRWLNLYLSGNISDGTDSVTVADLAALIAYAKAQGWIS